MKADSVYKEALKVTCVIYILGLIEFILFTIFMTFRTDILIGVLYGCTFVSANFFYLAHCVNKCADKDEKGAKAYMSATYSSRILLSAAAIIIAAKVDWIYIWAAIIPFAFTRIAATIVPFINKRRAKQ